MTRIIWNFDLRLDPDSENWHEANHVYAMGEATVKCTSQG